MLRFIGLILVLVGLAAAGLGLLAWTAPQERMVVEAAQAEAPERNIALVLPQTADQPGMGLGDVFGVEAAPPRLDASAPGQPAAAGGQMIPIAHETPREARFGQPFEVTLSIDATGSQSAAGALPGTGEIVEAQVELSGDIQARLNGGTAFEVSLLSPENQSLSSASPNVWRWTVMPLASGEHTLVIDVYMMSATGSLQPVSSYSDRVTVQVSTLRQAITFAQTANPLFMVLGGIGSVLGGAVTALRFFSRSTGRS
ncbi:MAG: hypothetical protein AAFX86_15255 [Pseudomonadota bacterium]